MAGLISDLLTLGACWLAIFGAVVLAYVVLLAALRLIIKWQHRQARRRYRAEVARIDCDTDAALGRISIAFMTAQRHLRDEVARGQVPIDHGPSASIRGKGGAA